MKRKTPKQMAEEITKLLQSQKVDANYLKKTFKYVRDELDIHGGTVKQKKLPDLLTEKELIEFYEAVWKSEDRTHMIMIKLLLYTGIRNAELANILLKDVDLGSLKVRIEQGKGKKDRYILIPANFKGELAQYILSQKEKNSNYLFETKRKDKYSTRWIREIIKSYAEKAKIKKRIYPHLLRHQLLTYLTQQGLIDAKIQLISGHSDRQSLAIYQDLSLAHVEEEYQNAMKYFPV